MKRDAFLEYLLEDALAPVEGVTARAMFGCRALYQEGLIFGIVDEGRFYLKADTRTMPAFKERGSAPLIYTGKAGREIALPYWEVPCEILEDREALGQWVRDALAVARRSERRKSSPARRKLSKRKTIPES